MNNFYFRVNNVNHYENKELVARNGIEPTLYFENDYRGGWSVRKIPTVSDLVRTNGLARGEIIYSAYDSVSLASYLNANEIKPATPNGRTA